MKNNRIHRVIVEDSKNSTFTGFITYETIFEYFVGNYYSDMIGFHLEIENLNIITKNIITVNKDETLLNCLEKFWYHKISVLPIVDNETSSIFGFFYLKDIVYFFANGEKFSVKHKKK
jgi:CBS domain-containing protein